MTLVSRDGQIRLNRAGDGSLRQLAGQRRSADGVGGTLRKARRLPSNVCAQFNTASGRRRNREVFIQHLAAHPFAPETFLRFLDSIRCLVSDVSEDDVLTRGYF